MFHARSREPRSTVTSATLRSIQTSRQLSVVDSSKLFALLRNMELRGVTDM